MPHDISARDAILVWDIILAGEDALEFVAGMDEAGFRASKLHQNAVIRSLEIVGEASNQLSVEFRLAQADVPWRQVIDMRNKLIHGYSTVNVERVWNSLDAHLPGLIRALRALQLS